MLAGCFLTFIGNWSLMFASISGQNSFNVMGERGGRQSYHTGTYFCTLHALHFMDFDIIWLGRCTFGDQ